MPAVVVVVGGSLMHKGRRRQRHAAASLSPGLCNECALSLSLSFGAAGLAGADVAAAVAVLQ